MLKIKNDIKLVISDFDGIFTDGGVYVMDGGKTAKKINYIDVMAVSLLLKRGIKIAIISGEVSPALNFIKNKFDLEDVFQGIRVKAPIVSELMEKYSLSPKEVSYIGDDFNDIEAMGLVENRFTVPNANYTIKDFENVQVTKAVGGSGAFRELADNILIKL